MPKKIKLVLQGDLIVPEDASETDDKAKTEKGRSTLRQGEEVQFLIGPEFTHASITFSDQSPLNGGSVVHYAEVRQVAHVTQPGVYRYDCAATDQNGVPRHSPGGGELEVIGA